jgi:hypothetical protein
MSIVSGRPGFVAVLAALVLGGRTAHAQSAPVTYWTPGLPIGFGSTFAGGQSANTYGNFPSFNGSDAQGGFYNSRYNFSNGWFVGSEGGGLANAFSQNALGSLGSVSYQGAQFGYDFQKNGSPVTVFAGLNTFKYNTGIGSNPLAPFDTTSGTLPVYNAHAGIEFRPTSNVSLALGFGYTQQSGRVDSDINSPSLVGASPFAFGRR